MAKITFKGNIGKDAQLRKVKIGDREDSVLSFWVAENNVKRDGTKKAEWLKVTIWRKYAEAMEKYLKAGRLVMVEGTCKAAFYTNKNNQVVPYIDVQGTEVTLLDHKPDSGEVPPDDVVESVDEEQMPF